MSVKFTIGSKKQIITVIYDKKDYLTIRKKTAYLRASKKVTVAKDNGKLGRTLEKRELFLVRS